MFHSPKNRKNTKDPKNRKWRFNDENSLKKLKYEAFLYVSSYVMKLTNQSALFQSLVIISSLKFLYEIVFRRKRWLRAFYQTNMGAQRYDKNFTQNIIFARERIICWDWFVKTGLKISNLSQRDTILMNLVTILVIFLPLEIKLKQTLIFCQLTLLNYFCRMA